jgi:hypothetical protein
VPVDALPHLYEEYVQGTAEEMKKPRRRGGTGLGLSIASKQVRAAGQIGAPPCHLRLRGLAAWKMRGLMSGAAVRVTVQWVYP